MKAIFVILLFLMAGSLVADGQPTLTGPTCVVPGTTYQYLINGKWDSGSTMQICATGALFVPLNGSCTKNGAPLASVLLVWQPGITSATLALTSSKGNASLAVSITTPLKAGAIMSTNQLQSIAFRGIPTVIQCGVDSGGSCNPVYTHQWQQSLDQTSWTNVQAATGPNLIIGPAQEQTIFFRRQTVETQSGTVAYSNVATVQVGAPPPGTLSFSMAGANPK
jgi:hypothetical protein